MPALKTIQRAARSRAARLGLLALPVAAWLYYSDVWLPPRTSTISVWYADKAFGQCTIKVPDAGSGFWIPSAAQIREAEAGLAPMFAARRAKGLTVPHPPDPVEPFQFHHQYIGFVQKGERVIFINAYPYYDKEALNDKPFALLEEPECVADGRTMFWNVVYHPRSRTFGEPGFNGA